MVELEDRTRAVARLLGLAVPGLEALHPLDLLPALVHSSFANEHPGLGLESNERLEFLGDAVLQLVISDHIYARFPGRPEGGLHRIRAALVCEPVLAELATDLGLGGLILLGRGEDASGGRSRPALLADAMEALIGAIYLAGGLELAGRLVLHLLDGHLEAITGGQIRPDYKTMLQEAMQRESPVRLIYEVRGEHGPDHAKTFEVAVLADGRLLGSGRGRSKKEAEQEAAREALGGISRGAANTI